MGHPPGTVELGFWTEDPDVVAGLAEARGHPVSRVDYADGHEDPLLTDGVGTHIRLGHPPDRGRKAD